ACLLTGAALDSANRLLAGLGVDGERMRANLDARGGYVLSEPVLRAVADRGGKHAAHTWVYEATMAGLDEGVELRTALLADPRIAGQLGADQIDRCLDPHAALGAAARLVDRVITPGSRS
ncbi:MAG TPA: hypothetical protein VHS54_07280, partial [Jatrophihabitans sp.]|nr:hypothetical protein [Jatrophihabitans sp.]